MLLKPRGGMIGVRDGSSYERAIHIETEDENEQLAREYQWMQESLPGSTLKRQELHRYYGRHFDVLYYGKRFRRKRKVYFDISASFGKDDKWKI